VSEPDRAICPNAARVRPAKGQKVRKALQEPPLHRRAVPVVNADDAAQSLGLSMKRAGCSNDKIRRRTANASLFGCFRLMAPRTRFERKITRSFESHASSGSGWSLIVLTPVSRGNRVLSFDPPTAIAQKSEPPKPKTARSCRRIPHSASPTFILQLRIGLGTVP
jgi:hypothetical protein